jgi:hypothetical protein
MKKRPNKKILEEAIDLLISESPLDFVRNAVGGIKNAGQGAFGNYRVGQIKTQANQFATVTKKQWDRTSGKIKQIADKMMDSKNDDVAGTGNEIDRIVDDAGKKISSNLDQFNQSIPSSISKSQLKQARDSATAEKNKFGIDWESLNIDPLKLQKNELDAMYKVEKILRKSGKSINKTNPEVVKKFVKQIVDKTPNDNLAAPKELSKDNGIENKFSGGVENRSARMPPEKPGLQRIAPRGPAPEVGRTAKRPDPQLPARAQPEKMDAPIATPPASKFPPIPTLANKDKTQQDFSPMRADKPQRITMPAKKAPDMSVGDAMPKNKKPQKNPIKIKKIPAKKQESLSMSSLMDCLDAPEQIKMFNEKVEYIKEKK